MNRNYLIVTMLAVFCLNSDYFRNSIYAATEEQNKVITLRIWPENSLGSNASVDTERNEPSRGDNIIRVSNITDPTITVYKPKQTEAETPAVIICPGGGYRYLSINLEGTEIADWLNSIGITAIILKYRAPNQQENAFKDTQRAVRIVRSKADELKINANQIGVIGFSAGAHLCVRVSGEFDNKSYEPVDEIDALSCKPDFNIVIYPAYLYNGRDGLGEAVKVSSKNPPTFIVQTQDDSVENSIYYYLGLRQAGVPSELHVFPKGGHGYGLRSSKNAVSNWPKLCEEWLSEIEILK